MMTSPDDRTVESADTTDSVGEPAGTMTQTALGGVNWETNESSDDAARAPAPVAS